MQLATAFKQDTVISLHHKHKTLEPRKSAPFGVSVSKSAVTEKPANEGPQEILNRLVIDTSNPYYVCGLDGVMLHCSSRFAKFVDSIEDGSTLPSGLARKTGDDALFAMQTMLQSVEQLKSTVKTQYFVKIKGRRAVVQGKHLPVLNEEGALIAVAGTYEDITAKYHGSSAVENAKGRLNDFARASSDWFFELDRDFKVISLSDRFKDVVGSSTEQYIGKRFDQFGVFATNLENRNDAEAALQDRQPFRDQLLKLTTAEGNTLRFHVSAVPVFEAAEDMFSGYRGVGMDVNQKYRDTRASGAIRKDLEQALTDLTRKNMALDVARSQAQAALKAKNDFMGSMRHELRTPLNAVIGFSEALKKENHGDLSTEHHEYVDEINTAGEHLLALINDILDISVIENDDLSLAYENVSLEMLVRMAVSGASEIMKEKDIFIKMAPVDQSILVRADSRRFSKILSNLLSNAQKFTPYGGRVGVDVEDKDTLVAITIWDNGVGIASEHQAAIFDKFHQLNDDLHTREQGGTGLGLHISRSLAQMMGGDITVVSQPNIGSRFTVTIPKGTDKVDKSSDLRWI